MTFTLVELREELELLGYAGIPDHVIFSSLSQLQVDIASSNNAVVGKNGSSLHPDVRRSKSSREVHGSPVPGDRDFANFTKTSTRSGGLGSLCFTSDFATELDEMRTMLRIMEGTKQELFGSVHPRSTSTKKVGLADEHEKYVGNLFSQWRLVGRTMRSKRKDNRLISKKTPDVSAEAVRLEGREWKELDQDNAIDAPTEAAFSSGQREHDYSERCDLLVGTVNQCEAGNDGEARKKSDGEEENRQTGKCSGGAEHGDHAEEDDATEGFAGNAEVRDVRVTKTRKVIDVEKGEIGSPSGRHESSSAISPGISCQQGGMLHPENLIDLNDTNLQYHVESLLSLGDTVKSPLPSPPSSGQKAVVDELSAVATDQFLAAFEKSLEELDPKDAIDQETFASVNQKLTGTGLEPFSPPTRLAQSDEDENPPDMSISVLRMPDWSGGGHQSPLNDRSNIHSAEDIVRPHPCAKAVFRIAEFNSAVTLEERTRSSGDLARIEKTEANGAQHISDVTEERSNTRIAVKSTPPPSVRKIRSEKVLRHSLSEKNVPRVTLRSRGASDPSYRDISPLEESRRSEKGEGNVVEDRIDTRPTFRTTPPPTARNSQTEKVLRHSLSEKYSSRITSRGKSESDASHLDIAALGLSPIRVRRATSPLKLSSTEMQCDANGLLEHRHATCTVCPPPSVRKSADGSSHGINGIKSPISKSMENASSESEASPKQRGPLRKGSGPSGIYTPLLDQRKHDINSKVLLKTSRLSSSMDFTSEGLPPAHRRSPSVRSSAESSRSSGGRQRTISSQDSKSNSGFSPLARTSPSTSLFGSSNGTPKDNIVPRRPRRGGKVDRVARIAEMQNVWKHDKFLKASSKRKPQSFHRIFARLHLSHERYTAAYRERVLEDMKF